MSHDAGTGPRHALLLQSRAGDAPGRAGARHHDRPRDGRGRPGFAESLDKRAIVVQDRAGFLVDYLLVPYLLDAVRLLEQAFATREDIDLGMMLGTGYPMGPLTLIDFVGLDVLLHETEVLVEAFKDPRFAAPTLLRAMAAADRLGRKSGRGFYDYASGERPPRR